MNVLARGQIPILGEEAAGAIGFRGEIEVAQDVPLCIIRQGLIRLADLVEFLGVAIRRIGMESLGELHIVSAYEVG